MPTPPGYKVWENTTPLTTAASPLLSGWFDTTGYTTLLVTAVFAGGTTTFSVEGSFDGSTQDTTMTYGTPITASTPAGGTSVVVQHSYVRFRAVQTVANGTTTTIFVQSRA